MDAVMENGTCDDAVEHRAAEMMGVEEEEEVELCHLDFEDKDLQTNLLASLNMMRKNRYFCDVILHVGNVEIPAHRAVLASVSQYLFELFSVDQDQKRTENAVTYKLNGGFDKKALQLLIEYAYTAKLEVHSNHVKAVYLAACHLKIDRVSRKCAQHLIKHLSIDNCIEIRSLPGIARNKHFIQQVDTFIAKEFYEITKSPSVLNLYCARIEILNQSKQEMSLVSYTSLGKLTLEWIRRQITEESLNMSTLSEKTFMLYLAIDNSLQDCSSLPSGDVCDSDIVQDYKKMSLKNSVPSSSKPKRKPLGQPSKPRVLMYNREIGEELEAEIEPDWNLIATCKVGPHSFLALVTLGGKLATLSVQLRLNVPSTPSPVSTPDTSRPASEEKPDLYLALANMAGPRCAVGCGNLHNTLLVCGGYDRVECLQSVEQYIPESNTWKTLPPMRGSRGRFQIAVQSDKVYAIGGSNGTTELDTVEMLDLDVGKWIEIPKLPLARSNAGVCELNGLIYCIGGWNGQAGIKQCDVYDPETSKWSSIASLNIGRYQSGVTAHNNLVFAVGGCDSWNCLNSVEVYDPTTNTWSISKPIISARRGCGVAVFSNKIYVVGGSDGGHSLNSTEFYDLETQTWVMGPSMTTSRANVEVAVVGDRLYAVGGFSGKTFLNTIEYLDEKTNEWTTFVPKDDADLAAFRSRSRTNSRMSVSEDYIPRLNGNEHDTSEDGNYIVSPLDSPITDPSASLKNSPVKIKSTKTVTIQECIKTNGTTE